MKMLGERVLVLRDDQEEKSAGGIILPKDEMPQGSGIIMAVGPDVKDVELGQRVIFKKLDGHGIKKDGKDHVILKEFNILGVYCF